jgi:DNA polymerase-3 subunit alpha
MWATSGVGRAAGSVLHARPHLWQLHQESGEGKESLMVNIHSHSDYSLLDGTCTCTQRAQRAAELGQWALALTDHGVLNGIPTHIKACEKAGIHPILGIEAYYRPNRFVEHSKEEQYNRHHLILIAQNLRGWHNLIQMSSESFRSGFYQSPCVDDDLLDRYSEGVLCTSSCVLGPISKSIQQDNGAATQALIERFAARYPGRFWLEMQGHDFDLQRQINVEIATWATRLGVPLIAGQDSHYDVPGKAATQKVVTLLGTNTTFAENKIKQEKRLAEGLDAYELWHEGMHMMSGVEVHDLFEKNHPQIPYDLVAQAVDQTDELAKMVLPFQLNRQLKMPRVVDSQEEAERRVRDWCRESMDRLGLSGNPVYEDKLEFEFSVIRKRKNFDYIYLIGLVVRWARSSDPLPTIPEDPFPMPKRPMRVGASRGSAGGSLVCYLSKITGMDPIGHKLSFERFLNVDRKGLPDIDIDFPSDRRDEVKEFVARLLGRDHVADVVAFGRFTPRAAIKDVLRIMGVGDFKEVKDVTDLIDPVHDDDLTQLVESIPALKKLSKKYPEAWAHSVILENQGDPLIKNTSKHAGGMVLMPMPINDFIPTIRADEDDPTQRTAWSETPRFSIVDEFGLVKADLLSIQGMEQQDRIIALIAERTGQEIDLDQLEVCRDPYAIDELVMEKFRQGLTLGVNQFEGANVTHFMKSARPQSLVDLAAINALYRPGPMGSGGHNHFAKRNTQQEPYEIHPALVEVLGDTYGVLAFQEQVMGVFEKAAGATPSQADSVRKIIAKLYREKGDTARNELEKLRVGFIGPAVEALGSELANDLWTQILPYSGYSFNRAHASGYGITAYQDMWLKTYYPAEFYTVLMTLDPKKAPLAIKEAAMFGMTVAGPDVNLSQSSFTVDYESKVIRFGLEAIDGVGPSAAQQIQEHAPYATELEFDLAHSFKYSKCNKGHRKAVLESGALDSLGARADWSENDKATTEAKRLSISLRPGGTFGDWEPFIQSVTHNQEELEELNPGSGAVVAGVITEVTKLVTKKGRNPGQQMGKIKIRFGLDIFEAVLFPPVWKEYAGKGVYVPDDAGYQIRAGHPCEVTMWNENGPSTIIFNDGQQILASDSEIHLLLKKDSKVIIRGEVDSRSQILAKGVMSISEFIASQNEQAAA